MTKYHPDWIFNLAMQLAVAICLSTLVLGLVMNVAPLTALWRSGLIFFVFVSLGWAVSLIWQVPAPSEVPVEAENEPAESNEPVPEN
ncbi:MAG: hypothetical protein KJ077_03200 [Anaerolineae bacterium]|nr:hypothetical protein [Anaerolineae bacterium]